MLFSVLLAFKLTFSICAGSPFLPTDAGITHLVRISNLQERKQIRSLVDLEDQIKVAELLSGRQMLP